MSDSAYRVDTTSRLAQWRIDNLSSCSYRKSDPFKIGNWNWRLCIEKNKSLSIKLYPEAIRENPPIASFVIRVVSSSIGERKCLVHPEVVDKKLKSNDDFIWTIETPFSGKCIIDLEFLDLKISSPNGTGPSSIWGKEFIRNRPNSTALSSLGRMLDESIHTDIIINATNGSISAHRAVLASRSPVFRTMFSHNLKEKDLSVIDITDMSIDSCQTFLNYIYGTVSNEEFLTHRMALLRAADKYDVVDLKQDCHDSLVEDIDTGNVLERLQSAHLYQLPELKQSCLRYLVQFGKIFDLRDEFGVLVESADRELIAEVVSEILFTWKGF